MNRTRRKNYISPEKPSISRIPLSLKRKKKPIEISNESSIQQTTISLEHQDLTSISDPETTNKVSNPPPFLKTCDISIKANEVRDMNVSPSSELSTPPSSPHFELPKDHFEQAKDYSELPKDHSELPKDHFELPKDHFELPKDYSELPKDHSELPKDHFEIPKDRETSLVISRPSKKRKIIDDELMDLDIISPNISSNKSCRILGIPSAPYLAGVVGLANLKNTCFANSVLQCLSNCSNFREFLFGKINIPQITPTYLVIFQMVQLLNHMWSGEYELLSPSSLMSTIQNRVKLDIGVEEDAHWFLQILLQLLDEELLNVIFVNNGVSGLFETKRRREYLCKKCHEVTHDGENRIMINTLPLPENSDSITQHSVCTLDDCLRIWSEDLEKGLCKSCFSSESDFSCQKVSIVQLPQILCFHFNRYRWTGKVINRATRSGAKGKINTKVSFPMKLDMSRYLSYKSEKLDREYALYNLVSVVVHDGLTPATGHYFSFCFNNISKGWYKFDDDHKPHFITESQVLRANPFMLFYQPLKQRPTKLSSTSMHQTIPKKGTTFLDEIL